MTPREALESTLGDMVGDEDAISPWIKSDAEDLINGLRQRGFEIKQIEEE